jgi:hypothetical protein
MPLGGSGRLSWADMDEELTGDEPVDHSRRRAAVILLATAVVALLVVAGIVGVTHRDGTKHDAAPLPTLTTSAPVPSPTLTTPTPKPTPKRKPVPHDAVAAAAPSGFTYRGAGFTVKATVCGMEYVRPLDPPGEQHHTVCWVQHDFGFAPGTNGQGTTYVLGHAWGQDPNEVLNKISSRATRQMLTLKRQGKTRSLSGIPTYPITKLNGNVVTLATPHGQLRYTVRDAYAVAKEQAGYVKSLMAEHTANRVVIITCGELNHVDYDYNIVVEAYLTSSVASAKSKT